MKEILSGNEAIARGAYEAGCRVACAYPGTPSTEILENTINYKEINSSWAPNEKVALEVAIGASFGGGRALCTMKHVGVNVAADPLFTLSYTGVNGGLVLVTADDPEMHSSQNEQDNRNYAKFAKVPMLEPSDSEECLQFTRLAFELSEQYDTPVMLRTTTRISHSKSVVELAEPVTGLPQPQLVRNAAKLVMLPGNARVRHPLVEERMSKLAEAGASMAINRLELRDTSIGIITSGACYQYVREVFPEASTLKLGMVHPLPQTLIRDFASRVERLFVVEELDPFIEDQVKAMGLAITGKEILPICGELTPERIQKAFAAAGIQGAIVASSSTAEPAKLPPRPPNMCPGCPHRGVFYTLNQLKAYVTGDIGCYTLGFMPPLSAMDTCVCMGASVGMATGVTKVVSSEEQKKVVAVIGDSTFLHTGINGLMDMVYNQSPATLIILDNRITAMTGRQDNPASGFTLMDDPTHRVDLPLLCKAVGVQHIRLIDPFDLEQTRKVIQEEMNRPEPSVIITDKPCVLIKREGVFEKGIVLEVDEEGCVGCRACLKIGCPAIEWRPGEGQRGKAYIEPLLCTGCDVCRQLCKFNAIGRSK
ncbi:indolepyruvate ferredoxin oxidoreductase subunit alpha [Geobacter sp. SVR]|uniref:indolepyruvate ferredoxin oxidoreductase subunit alpha n=1 Tax=Geobacter sp. SVR TaxID=2495594 RepID=UPI00143EF7FC|nr:indolepyruvate ferredoxin oxidoreductase subunit alpha [Geobacter sp. SVR]BCS54000.1 indolepyruvate oxidoreductase subunit IorA [Geobacter sp. SVR]GCF86219.1 indolepyruvate oxidoreductase subunit IorA [Geobacter sp. SVR]